MALLPTNDEKLPVMQYMLKLFEAATHGLEDVKEGSHAEMADTLLLLSSEGLSFYSDLWLASGSGRVSMAAYAARNLLEILVWTRYCMKSPEHTSQFRQDAERDMNGIRGVLLGIADLETFAGKDRTLLSDEQKEYVNRIAALEEGQQLNKRYKTVSIAASEVGPEMGGTYKNMNIFLSKFAHPTAITVRCLWPKELTNVFLEMGSRWMAEVFATVAQREF